MFIEKFYRFLDQNIREGRRKAALYGGAGSGKSKAMAQWITLLFAKHEDLSILVTRKTAPSLRITAYKDLIETMDDWNIPYYRNDTRMDFSNGSSVIYCRGLDDLKKIKSVNVNIVWMEEATEFSWAEFEQFDLRLRRVHPLVPNRLYLTFNPIDQYHWAVEKLIQGGLPDVDILRTTYMDNPFLGEDFLIKLKRLKVDSPDLYRVYTLGLPGVLEHTIYRNWEIIDEKIWPALTHLRNPTSYGLDFGYNEPCALYGIWRHEKTIFIRELLYRTGMTNPDIVHWMEGAGIKRSTPIYADPSRPESIEDIARAGFNCQKGNNRVAEGIDYVKAFHLVFSPDAVSALKEARGYSYKVDKNGKPTDEPVDFNNHAMDAIRYAIFSDRPALSKTQTVPYGAGGGVRGAPTIYSGDRVPKWGNK